jgi:hypothetical protein
MSDLDRWLADLGMPSLPALATPAVAAPVVRAQRPTASTQGGMHLARLGSLASPAFPLVAVQAVMVSQHQHVWKALSDPEAQTAALAFAWSDGSCVRLGLWTPTAVSTVVPEGLGTVERWSGANMPPVVKSLVEQGADLIAHQPAVAQAVFAANGWASRRWVSPTVLLAEANKGADLDEVAAWLIGVRPTPLTATNGSTGTLPTLAKLGTARAVQDAVAAWHELRGWTGIIGFEADVERTVTLALIVARLNLAVGATFGTVLPTTLEERGWQLDQTINTIGLPFDRTALTAAVSLAHSRLPLKKGVSPVTTKLREILEYGALDDAVHGAYVYAGQHHGRWNAAEPAIHNLARPTWSRAQVRAMWRALKSGRLTRCASRIPEKVIEQVVVNLERGVFVAPPGYVFVVADQSAAEPRRVFQVTGRMDVLAVMQAGDLYTEPRLQLVLFKDVVPKGHPDWARRRLVLKVMVIACGYGMAAETLATYAKKGWHLDLTAKGVRPEAVVEAYHELFPEVRRLWSRLGSASMEAVDSSRAIDTPVGQFRRVDDNLHLVLPSGRAIIYPEAINVMGDHGPVLGYRHGGPLTGQGDTAWGGTLLCHATCGTLRDIHVHHLVTLQDEGWQVVAHTHDEVVLLVPSDLAERASERVQAVMSTAPAWAGALPLKVEPYSTERLGMKGLTR